MKVTKKVMMWAMALTMIPVGLASSIASADVTFQKDTLKEVYNPGGNIYAYAPFIIKDGDTEHMFICRNSKSGVIRDEIYYIQRVKGEVKQEKSVLKAGPQGAWDSFHVCDPAIVAGKYKFNGAEYKWAMFYLGNDVDASRHNQIGVAFSNDLGGEWVKYPNPIVEHADDGSWGVGQPSVTSVDGNGFNLLFYTQGDAQGTFGYRREVKLGDMSNPFVGSPVAITSEGLTDIDGNPDWLNNFDLVYDPSRDCFYMVREQHPYPISNPNYIGESLQILSIPGVHIWVGDGEWREEAVIDRALTKFPRNHNAGILRSLYGTLPDPGSLKVFFTDSTAGELGRAEWSYDIWEIVGKISY